MAITASTSATLSYAVIAVLMMFVPQVTSKILLDPGKYFTSGIYVLIMQRDCNLVVTHNAPNDIPVWATNTSTLSVHDCRLELTENCQLRVKSRSTHFIPWTNSIVIKKKSRLPCELHFDDNFLYLTDAQKHVVWHQNMNQIVEAEEESAQKDKHVFAGTWVTKF